MSVWEDVLVSLRNIIQDSDDFKGIEIYFDEAEMSSNTPLPAISFKVGKKELQRASMGCREYIRHIEIRLHTKTVDKRKLQSELYDYEEQLISAINDADFNGSIPSFYEIKETGALPIVALMWNARPEGGQFDYSFFSNMLRIKFDIRYEI